MPIAIQSYGIVYELCAKGLLDLRSTNLKLALFTKDYTPNLSTHTCWADLADELSAAGTGYTAGGIAVGNPAVTRTGEVTTLDADDVTFVSLNATFKYAVLYYDETLDPAGSDEIIKPLAALIDFDDSLATADITVPDKDFVVYWQTEGILELGPCAEVCA